MVELVNPLLEPFWRGSAIPRCGCGCLDATSQKCAACQAAAASSKPDRIVELIATYHQRKSIKELGQRCEVHRTTVAALLGRYNARRGAGDYGSTCDEPTSESPRLD
jgi:hypothetical protein